MTTLTNNPKMLMVASFPPRECGIATFTQDLINATDKIFGHTLPVEICALENDPAAGRAYDQRVKYILHNNNLEAYRQTADAINERNDIGMVCIQHEFGLFGGEFGDALLSFMLALNKPIATVFHTVLPGPNEKLHKVVNAICNLSEKIIVQTHQSHDILLKNYDCTEEMIAVIPHGTHIVLWKDKARLKKKYGYENNMVLSTFGLLSDNKNIETVLYALPGIVKQYPETKYLILGKTHPELVRREGEKYREKLMRIISELGLEDNVVFVNRFLELHELLEYLNLSDIYLFASKDPNQAVSGTFVYANSAGCPVISTPIPHAKEVIDDGTGILLNSFDEPEAFEAAIRELIENKEKRIAMGKNAFAKMRPTSWENSAISFGKIFGELTDKDEDLRFQLPAVNNEHLRAMTTDFGMLQFSQFCQPDPESGYTLDDNARGLIATVMHYETNKDASALQLAQTYLNFIGFVQQEDGTFQNYVDINRRLTSQNAEVNLEDANGRAFWALGQTLSFEDVLPMEIIMQTLNYWNKGIHQAEGFTSPRAMGFVMKGLYYHHQFSNDKADVVLADKLAKRLLQFYHLKSESTWEWYEDYMTYANSILPEAMLYAYLMTGNEEYRKIAEVTFDFLLSHYFMKGKIKVISNKGWFNKRNKRHFFGEQPIEVSYIIFTLKLFHEETGKSKYRDQLEVAFSWFMGNNHLNQIMYNPVNGAGYDGLEETHININQGAESSICYFMARLVMESYGKEDLFKSNNKLLLRRTESAGSNQQLIIRQLKDEIDALNKYRRVTA